MLNNILCFIVLTAFTFVSCNESDDNKSFTERLESAHKKADFQKHNAVSFDIALYFNGTERMNGTMVLATNSSASRISLKDSSTILVNQDKIFYSPNLKDTSSVRFNAYTWSYFFMMPYKISDSGVVLTENGRLISEGKTFPTQKMSFKKGIGDAPDDWYILYVDSVTNLLNTAAYIVSFGRTAKEAEANPHAISYSSYKEVDGIPIATSWTFWEWNEKGGVTKKIGDATISNVKFLDVKKEYFTAPAGYLSK
jgi:hypothetical protein